MPEKECHEIRKIDNYTDGRGHDIIVFSPVFGKNKDDVIIKGVVTLQAIAKSTNGAPVRQQQIPLEFAFPEGTNIKKAFEMFDEIANAEVEKFKEKQRLAQIEKQKEESIVSAHSMPSLLGSNGRPIR